MAAGKRIVIESENYSEPFKAYRARLKSEQAHIDHMAKGRMIFQSTFLDGNGNKMAPGKTYYR